MVVPPPTLPIRSSANIWYDGGVVGMVVWYHHTTISHYYHLLLERPTFSGATATSG